MKKKRFNDIVTVQYEKCCEGQEEIYDFVNRVRDENPNIVFFRRELLPDPTTAGDTILVTITGWYDYRDTSKPRKKQNKKELK